MRYLAIVRYFGGQTEGYTVEANDTEEAWEKLMKAIPLKKVQSVEMTMIYTEDRELK